MAVNAFTIFGNQLGQAVKVVNRQINEKPTPPTYSTFITINIISSIMIIIIIIIIIIATIIIEDYGKAACSLQYNYNCTNNRR